MAIFSRRTVDRMLRENADFLTKEQLDQHVARLNTKGFQSLDAEWEVAVLNACSKIGRVQQEPLLEGTSKLDLLFTTKAGCKFLADITTVSDEGLEEKEPVEASTRIETATEVRGSPFSWLDTLYRYASCVPRRAQ